MFAVRLVEHPLPSVDRDVDALIEWMIDTLSLVRKRGDATADLGRAGVVHRLLRDHLFGAPGQAWDAQMLADELAQMPAALNHHLGRLVETGLIGTTNEGKGWRKYYLRGGSLQNAVAHLQQHSNLILNQRMAMLNERWTRTGEPLPVELPQDESAPFSIGLVDHRPVPTDAVGDAFSHWMNDFGLLGERPGQELAEDSLSVSLFATLLSRDLPLSLDEAAELHDGQKARVGRILDRFRASGMVERVPRTDRLNSALWTAMTTQYQRRGEDWMLKKGGFQRLLNAKQQGALLKSLTTGALSVEAVEQHLADVEAREQMLLLNLLGGRLPMGYRMAGSTPSIVQRHVQDRLDRVLRRMVRVAGLLDEALAEHHP
jgi:predicted transcriptional regulator